MPCLPTAGHLCCLVAAFVCAEVAATAHGPSRPCQLFSWGLMAAGGSPRLPGAAWVQEAPCTLWFPTVLWNVPVSELITSALLVWTAFGVLISLFLSQSIIFLTLALPVLSPLSHSEGEWTSSCVRFSCLLGLNHSDRFWDETWKRVKSGDSREIACTSLMGCIQGCWGSLPTSKWGHYSFETSLTFERSWNSEDP